MWDIIIIWDREMRDAKVEIKLIYKWDGQWVCLCPKASRILSKKWKIPPYAGTWRITVFILQANHLSFQHKLMVLVCALMLIVGRQETSWMGFMSLFALFWFQSRFSITWRAPATVNPTPFHLFPSIYISIYLHILYIYIPLYIIHTSLYLYDCIHCNTSLQYISTIHINYTYCNTSIYLYYSVYQ